MAADSPSYAKVSGEVVRASAALPAAGAYDTAGATFRASVVDRDVVALWYTYTRGAASGSAKIKIFGSCDNGTTYAPMLIVDTTVAPVAGLQNLIVAQFQLPASTGAAAEEGIVPPIDVSGVTHIQVLSAEVGNTGTPGTLLLTLGSRRAGR